MLTQSNFRCYLALFYFLDLRKYSKRGFPRNTIKIIIDNHSMQISKDPYLFFFLCGYEWAMCEGP